MLQQLGKSHTVIIGLLFVTLCACAATASLPGTTASPPLSRSYAIDILRLLTSS